MTEVMTACARFRVFTASATWRGSSGSSDPGCALADGAEAAVARADVAADHEGGGAVGPALEDVRAARLLADRVQVQLLDQLEDVVLVRRVADVEPSATRASARAAVASDGGLLMTLSSRLKIFVLHCFSTSRVF